MAASQPSLLEIVQECHDDAYLTDATLAIFEPDGVHVGYIQPVVRDAIIQTEEKRQQNGQRPVFRVDAPPAGRSDWRIRFVDGVDDAQARTDAVAEVLQDWREQKLFPDPLDGWRNELYTIYTRSKDPSKRYEPLLAMERAACALFGLKTYGTHMTAYTDDMRIWVARRSKTKQTWPNYLDNTVAGGIAHGSTAFDTMVKECGEEAGLDEEFVRKNLKQTGVISYCYLTKAGWIQPEVEYTYDLLLPPTLTPSPTDGEVSLFTLHPPTEILSLLRAREFKPNCALVLIDFFIRHGILNTENEREYTAIVAALHRQLGMEGP